MLNEGIRVFDLRYAYNPGLDTIGFYHCRCFYILAVVIAACVPTSDYSSQGVVESHNENGRCLLRIVLLA